MGHRETELEMLTKLLGPGNYRRIARRADLSYQHVARIIKGTRGASFHVAARVAAAADVSLDQLYRFIRASPLLKVQGRRTRYDNYPEQRHEIVDLRTRQMERNRLGL